MATGGKIRLFRLASLLVAGLLVVGGGLRTTASEEKGARDLFLNPGKGIGWDPGSGATIPTSTGSEQKARQGRPVGKPQALEAEKPRQTSNTGLLYKIEVVGEKGEISWATSSRTFFSGERLRFHFETNVDGHLLILHKDPSGKSAVLFPDSRIRNGDNYVERGKDYVIPPDGGWFRFDRNPGKEELTVFLSQSRLEEVDHLKEKREVQAEQARSLYAKAEQVQGDKGLTLEVDEADPQKPTINVNRSHDPKSLLATTIVLNHR